MKRRFAAIVLAALMMASLSGCASLFNKEYFSVSDYEDAETEVGANGATEIRNYFGLKLAVSQLVSAHAESGTFDFRSYDGNITDDIASACKEISTNTALGAYSVDYISYDLDRIVAYYEANVYIFYKRTAEETGSIVNVSGATGLYQSVMDALENLNEKLVIMVSATTLDEDDVAGYVSKACREDPLCCAVKPEVTVKSYSGSSLQKIFEIDVDYGGSREELLAKRQQLSDAVSSIAGEITAEGDAYRALQAATLLANRCRYDGSAGSTAYSAVVDGAADSEGIAMAYCAICKAAGISCVVVSGRMDKAQHYWNIFGADGDYYHADISRAATDGFAQTFLINDANMWGKYWWDTELYPACDGSKTYTSIMAEKENT